MQIHQRTTSYRCRLMKRIKHFRSHSFDPETPFGCKVMKMVSTRDEKQLTGSDGKKVHGSYIP